MESNNTLDSQSSTIVLAGATGDLGGRIAKSLLEKEANVRALVRSDSDAAKVDALRHAGATICELDYHNAAELTKACEGAGCVVSALSGLHYVMVGIQSLLLNAAVATGVPRFISSDFAIDFNKLPYGNNRNLNLRKEFRERLNKAPVAATSIHNGMFADLLTGQGLFNTIINVTKALTPNSQEVFPAWQGMQYMRDMFSVLPKLEPLDNDRYPEIKWTRVAEVLAKR